jgi:carboxymethylenebutenolidase
MPTSWSTTVPSHDGQSFGAYVALPSAGSGPGIVLCQEIFGVNAQMRAIADRLAEEGYVVFVPDLFWRIERDIDLGYGEADLALAMALRDRLEDVQAVHDIGATAAALRAHPACRGKVGAVGFCLGGRLAVLAGAEGHVDCVVAYHPAGLEKMPDALRRTEVPMVLHFGGVDQLTPPPAVATIRQVLAGKRAVEIYVYPEADHAFTVLGRPSYDASATGMAYTRTIALLRRVLGPYYDLSALWEVHRSCEFVTRDAEATMRTMVARPYVNHVPTMTGGFGQADLHRFYRDHFIPNNPKDMRNIPISRTVGADRIVNEGVLCFTHDCEIEWMLPGVPPTGKYVEVALVGIVTFRGDKLVHEHIYWDQASVLVQIGMLDPSGLPVAGAAAARKVMHPELPSNELMPGWARNTTGAASP